MFVLNFRQRLRITLWFMGLTVLLCAIHDLLVWRVGDYEFLLWNLLLAAVPLFLIFAIKKQITKQREIHHLLFAAILGIIWLAFLPNTFYLLSEFMHLSPVVLVNMPGDMAGQTVDYTRGDVLYVFDSLLLMLSVLYGGISGGIALMDGYRLLRDHSLSKTWCRVITGCVMVLIPIGIFIGRYGRWNSWDLLIQPLSVLTDTIHQLSTSTGLERFCLLLLTIGIFEIMSLAALWSVQSINFKK